jgi:hypothetical protein
VYSIEINARLTGYTHMLADMQFAKRKIPFLLLHTLELGNYKYEVEDLEALPSMYSLDQKYSYMILNNLVDRPIKLEKEIRTGLYRLEKGTLTYIKPSYTIEDIKDDRYLLIFSKYGKGESVERGKRVLKIIRRGSCMAANGDLDLKNQKLVQLIKEEFAIPG